MGNTYIGDNGIVVTIPHKIFLHLFKVSANSSCLSSVLL